MSQRLEQRRVGMGECADGQKGHPLEAAVVSVRLGNYSAFNGYRFAPSDYSEIVCTMPGCNARWRTKASYVGGLTDQREIEVGRVY